MLAAATNLDDLTAKGWAWLQIVDDEMAEALAAPLQLAKAMPAVAPLQALYYLKSCYVYWSMPNGPAECVIPGGPVLTHKQLQAIAVDGAAAVQAIEEQIVLPTQQALTLINAAARVTRLVTRVSPEEMDRDRVFAFNPALAEVASTVSGPVFNEVCARGWYGGGQKWRFSINGLGSWLLTNVGVVDSVFKALPAASWKGLIDETGQPQTIATADIAVVDQAILGAKPGKPALPKDLVLKPITPWVPPPSDPLVTYVGAWYAPQYCVPKPCWKSGSPPPTGTCNEPPPDSSSGDSADTAPPMDTALPSKDAADTAQPDLEATTGPEGGPVPGIDAAGGWKDTATDPEPEVTANLDGAVADDAKAGATPAKSAAVDDGCTAGHGSAPSGFWAALLATVAGLWWRQRRDQGSAL